MTKIFTCNKAYAACLLQSSVISILPYLVSTTFEALEVKNQMSHLLPFPKANFRKRSYLLTLRFSYIKLFLCYKNFFPDQLCFTKLTFLLLTFFTNIDLCSLIGRLLLFLILSLAHITMAVYQIFRTISPVPQCAETGCYQKKQANSF